jgi:(+)-trans-carveol dehydrogenase
VSGRVEGKVAVVTGAARGQGRSHAVRLAQEGADVIATDIAAQVDSVPYPLASREDLDETARLVRARGRRVVVAEADVRNYEALRTAIDAGVAQLGRLDIVVANAGILSYSRLEDMAEATWQDMIDINLTGAWHTAKAAIPHLRATGGGSIILTSSVAGVSGLQNVGASGPTAYSPPRWTPTWSRTHPPTPSSPPISPRSSGRAR